MRSNLMRNLRRKVTARNKNHAKVYGPALQKQKVHHGLPVLQNTQVSTHNYCSVSHIVSAHHLHVSRVPQFGPHSPSEAMHVCNIY